MEEKIENSLYKDINSNLINININKKNITLDNLTICDEIKKLKNTIEELEKKIGYQFKNKRNAV